MTPFPLEQLKSDTFQARIGFVATAPALRRLLNRSPEVKEVKQAFRTGEVTETSIGNFVKSLMRDLSPGVPFRHDLALAALAVVLEKRPTQFAEEFLRDLAQLKLAEMSMSIRVARECLASRVDVAANKRSTLQLAEPGEVKILLYQESSDLESLDRPGQMRRIVKCGVP
jgi:hypothetical protein